MLLLTATQSHVIPIPLNNALNYSPFLFRLNFCDQKETAGLARLSRGFLDLNKI